MKTFFFSLFVLFLLAFAGGTAFLVTTLEPASFMKEAERLGVLEATEKLLPSLARLTGLPNLQEKADLQLGFCRFMTYPSLHENASLGRITEINGEPVPYLEPITLDKRSLQCQFNGVGKSVLLVPTEKSQLSVRRALDRSGTLVFTSGELTVFSDALDVRFALNGLEIQLLSKTPTMLKLSSKGDALPYEIFVMEGQVEIAYRRLSTTMAGAGVKFFSAPGVQLSYAGHVFSRHDIALLPSGFGDFESKGSGTAPPPSAPRKYSSKVIAELWSDPIHRPLLAKVFSLVDDVSNRALRFRLAEIFPRTFGFPFVCHFTPTATDANPGAILPGEWINAPGGGKLSCPEHFELSLAAGTLLQVRRSDDTPLFGLEQGEVKADFGGEEFFFSTPAYVSQVKGHGAHQQVTFSSMDNRQALECGIGEVSAKFSATSDTGPSPLLISRNCRLEVSPAEGAPRTLFSNEKIHFGNLALASEFLPFVPINNFTTFTDFSFSSIASLTTTPGGTGKMIVNLERSYEGHGCKLYAKKKDLDQPNLIRSFQGQNGLALQVESQYVPGFVAIVCGNGTYEAASASTPTVTQ